MVNTEKLTSIHEKNGTNQEFTNTDRKSDKIWKNISFLSSLQGAQAYTQSTNNSREPAEPNSDERCQRPYAQQLDAVSTGASDK